MKIVMAAVPFVDSDSPIMAPGLLTSILQSHGYNCVGLDINAWVYNYVNQHPKKQKLLDFFYNQQVHQDVTDDLTYIIDRCTCDILQHQPTIVGLSLLIYTCQIFTKWLSASLKHHNPNIQIVIGGAGIHNFIAEGKSDFCDQVRNLGIVDDYISGDGDLSLVEYIKGNRDYPGINSMSWNQVADMNTLPAPDYRNYDWSQYANKEIPILDSRGCVKNCEFCDIIEYWKKFNFRTAENVFAEMLSQVETYGFRHFVFRNSLINGNLKEFKKLITLIADYNRVREPEQQLSWGSYFIVRQQSQHPPEMWQQLKENNAHLYLGVESLIPEVRKGMGKTFTNEDLNYHLEQAKAFNVAIVLLLIVAYPTETLADYETTKQWFRDNAKYSDTISAVNLSLASILPNTNLARRSDKYQIKMGSLPAIWINQNLKITPSARKQYLEDLVKICVEHNYKFLTNEHTVEHTND